MSLHPLVDRLYPLLAGEEDYVLWSEGEGRATAALGAALRVTVRDERVEVTSDGEVLASEPTRDPFTTVPDVLRRHAGSGFRAYGYVAFEASRFYRPYRKWTTSPSIELVVPRVRVELLPGEESRVHAADDARRRAVESALRGAPDLPPEAASDEEVLALAEGGRAAFEDAIRGALARLGGPLQKVILARHVEVPGQLDPIATFRRSVRARAVRRFAFRLGSTLGVGLSPEVVLTARGRDLATTPLAGTRPRGASAAADEAAIASLLADPKELSEHAMSVRCAYDEMAQVSTAEALRVVDFMRVKSMPFTHHIASRVLGSTREGLSAWDGLRAVFPGITASGLDKDLAIALIDELETAPRRIYAGAVGWVDASGDMDWGIALRSAFSYEGRVLMSAGAGIVRDSEPGYEFHESVTKLRTIASHLVRC